MQLQSIFGFLGASHLAADEIDVVSMGGEGAHSSGFGSMLAAAFQQFSRASDRDTPEPSNGPRPAVVQEQGSEACVDSAVIEGLASYGSRGDVTDTADAHETQTSPVPLDTRSEIPLVASFPPAIDHRTLKPSDHADEADVTRRGEKESWAGAAPSGGAGAR